MVAQECLDTHRREHDTGFLGLMNATDSNTQSLSQSSLGLDYSILLPYVPA